MAFLNKLKSEEEAETDPDSIGGISEVPKLFSVGSTASAVSGRFGATFAAKGSEKTLKHVKLKVYVPLPRDVIYRQSSNYN